MSSRSIALADRRMYLQRKTALQREQLGEAMASIESPLRGIDQGIGKVRGFIKRPLVVVGGAALFWFLGPRRALGLASKAAFLIPLARRLLARYM
jgi:hypothetical protein